MQCDALHLSLFFRTTLSLSVGADVHSMSRLYESLHLVNQLVGIRSEIFLSSREFVFLGTLSTSLDVPFTSASTENTGRLVWYLRFAELVNTSGVGEKWRGRHTVLVGVDGFDLSKKLGCHKQVARQLHTQYVEGIYSNSDLEI